MQHQRQDQKISLRQYVLPYWNYSTGRSGWQFGLPPQESSESPVVRVAQKNGQTFSASNFSITRPHETRSDQHPMPEWFWVPVRTGGTVKFASVLPPADTQGSVPLSRLRQTSRDRIFSADAAEDHSIPLTATDMPFSVRAEREASDLRVGRLILAEVKTAGGLLRWIKPLEAAEALNLWTSHLIRLAQLKLTHGIEV
jgi:hypothetical protein